MRTSYSNNHARELPGAPGAKLQTKAIQLRLTGNWDLILIYQLTVYNCSADSLVNFLLDAWCFCS